MGWSGDLSVQSLILLLLVTRTEEDQMLIPCRDSRLTQLFQNYLVGKGKGVKQGKISMIVNVSNNVSVYDETIYVLRFSALTSKV